MLFAASAGIHTHSARLRSKEPHQSRQRCFLGKKALFTATISTTPVASAQLVLHPVFLQRAPTGLILPRFCITLPPATYYRLPQHSALGSCRLLSCTVQRCWRKMTLMGAWSAWSLWKFEMELSYRTMVKETWWLDMDFLIEFKYYLKGRAVSA